MTMQGEDMTDTPEETERKRKKAKSESGGVLAGIAEGASDIIGGALDIGGAVVSGAADVGGVVVSGIGEIGGAVVEGVAEAGGAALEGMGGCAEGCAGCTAVIVVMGLPVVGLLGWFGAHLIA